ncbi:MAG: hypothetical protein Q8882_04995 [Bacillota bacterium]|nr:hypothetical protein [Bacillota bacterium]
MEQIYAFIKKKIIVSNKINAKEILSLSPFRGIIEGAFAAAVYFACSSIDGGILPAAAAVLCIAAMDKKRIKSVFGIFEDAGEIGLGASAITGILLIETSLLAAFYGTEGLKAAFLAPVFGRLTNIIVLFFAKDSRNNKLLDLPIACLLTFLVSFAIIKRINLGFSVLALIYGFSFFALGKEMNSEKTAYVAECSMEITFLLVALVIANFIGF